MNRFVLLEHRWQGVHWDLMLERGGALCTWAIDRPIIAGVDLPARALADHRLAYLDYEGEVGGGRGSVVRVDRGAFETRLWTPDRVRVQLAGAQLKGEAELRRLDIGPSGLALSWVLRLGNFD